MMGSLIDVQVAYDGELVEGVSRLGGKIVAALKSLRNGYGVLS